MSTKSDYLKRCNQSNYLVMLLFTILIVNSVFIIQVEASENQVIEECFVVPDSFTCEGTFRSGYECSNGTDSDWNSSAVPDAYNDSASVIEYYDVPTNVDSASLRIKVLRNNLNIEIKLFYWDYISTTWEIFYEVPYSLDYSEYTISVPMEALNDSQLIIKTQVKNAGAMSGEYFDGEVCFYSTESSLTIPPLTAQTCDDECVVIPVTADLSDAIRIFQVPLEYSAGEVCSISTVGLLTENWWKIFELIDNETGYYSVSMSDTSSDASGYLPSGEHTLFNVYYKPNRECQTNYYVPFDTIYSDDVSKRLAFGDTSYATILPLFNSDSIEVIGYVPGDFDNNDQVDISDLLGLVDYMFLPPGAAALPCLMKAMDVNGDCTSADISDLLKMVDYMFLPSGSATLECACSNPIALKINPDIQLYQQLENGKTSIILNSEEIFLGMELYVKGDITNISSSLVGFELFHRQENGMTKIGLLDMEGIEKIKTGVTSLIEIDGEIEIVSGILTDANFNSIPINQSSKVINLPTEFALSQNYPNPFNPTTEINFSLPQSSNVVLEIFNINGQQVTTLIDGYFEAGHHQVVWDSRDIRGNPVASGIYLYRLSTGEFVQTKKMVLLK